MLQHCQNQNADPRPAWIFSLFLLALLFRLSCFTGLIGSDDVYYSVYAEQISEALYIPEEFHIAIRYGFLLPVGLIYALFGISEWSSIAVPLFASSLSVVLLTLVGARLFGLRVGLIAGLIYIAFPLDLRYATVLVPEAVAGCYILLAMLVHVRATNKASMAMGVLSGVFVGIAYLTKEPAVLVGPALFIDAALRRNWRQTFGIVFGGCVIVACEHLYYFLTTGDLLFRLHAMAIHNTTNNPAGFSEPLDMEYRLFKSYPRMMLVPNRDFGLHSLTALILSAIGFWRFRKDRRTYFLLSWASIPWLYLNFGSSSLTSFIPIPIAPRYIFFVYPPLFLLSAWLIAELMSTNIWTRQVILSSMVAVVLTGLACGLLTRGTGYETDQIAVLRVIADIAEQESLDCIHVDVERSRVREGWEKSLHILSGGKLSACDYGSGGAIVSQDRFGIPYLVAGRP